jgi:hypothetical protein
MTRLQKITFLAFLAFIVVAMASISSGQGQAPPAEGRGRGQVAAPPPPQLGHPSGKLIIWGDVALFERPGMPNNCILTNRFRKGQRLGFRMTAFDGGSGKIENTAVLVAHLTVGGSTVDVPMRWRGGAPPAPSPQGYLRSPVELWTGFWTVPDDAPTGALSYTVTATDRFGRTATFTPFSYAGSQITIVE